MGDDDWSMPTTTSPEEQDATLDIVKDLLSRSYSPSNKRCLLRRYRKSDFVVGLDARLQELVEEDKKLCVVEAEHRRREDELRTARVVETHAQMGARLLKAATITDFECRTVDAVVAERRRGLREMGARAASAALANRRRACVDNMVAACRSSTKRKQRDGIERKLPAIRRAWWDRRNADEREALKVSRREAEEREREAREAEERRLAVWRDAHALALRGQRMHFGDSEDATRERHWALKSIWSAQCAAAQDEDCLRVRMAEYKWSQDNIAAFEAAALRNSAAEVRARSEVTQTEAVARCRLFASRSRPRVMSPIRNCPSPGWHVAAGRQLPSPPHNRSPHPTTTA
eukprot:Hpha_TRINITY_DN15532_c2_g3::TRINITY_DN15532_c2_g3_i1::g.109059::m.109059